MSWFPAARVLHADLHLFGCPQAGAQFWVLPLIFLPGKQKSAEHYFEASGLAAQHDLIIRRLSFVL